MLMKIQPISAKNQSGVMLLEALIAILIFSLGILTVVALQATSIKLTGDAKYRTNATLLANRLIGQMWVSTGNLAALKANFETGGASYNDWLADVSGPDGLPGVVPASSGVTSTRPTVTVNATAGATAGQVTITLFWRTPEQPLNDDSLRHRHVVISQIVKNIP
jgi:type IV pilus assembly protein PilV